MDYLELYNRYKEQSLFGRYITLQKIEPLLEKLHPTKIGTSVLGKPIYQYTIGNGKTKVFMWSQMHGNESTTTKALFDFFNFLNSNEKLATTFLSTFSLCILPMVNPDGAEAYTRVNANDVDLNRDSVNLSQPESVALRQVFDTFQPDYCFNLHDQRTIFGAGNTGNPATVSFLAPAYNEAREINAVREKAMLVIVAMNDELQQHIPNQVGRFDDGFNLNCIGDMFTSLGVPTVLFEAGHYQNDYYREFTRKMIFIALLSGLKSIFENDVEYNKIENYMKIPQNEMVFFDFLYKNVKINCENKEIITNFAAQFKEELIGDDIQFRAYIAEIGSLENKYGHYQYNAHKMKFLSPHFTQPNINDAADFCIGELKTIFKNGIKI